MISTTRARAQVHRCARIRNQVLDAEDTTWLMKSIASELPSVNKAAVVDFASSTAKMLRHFVERGNFQALVSPNDSSKPWMEHRSADHAALGDRLPSVRAAVAMTTITRTSHQYQLVGDPDSHNHVMVNRLQIGNDARRAPASGSRRWFDRRNETHHRSGHSRCRNRPLGLSTRMSGPRRRHITPMYFFRLQYQIKAAPRSSPIAVLPKSLPPTASGAGRIAAFEFLAVPGHRYLRRGNRMRLGDPDRQEIRRA